jgi:ATP-dependent DNA helicase RecQ
MVAPELSRRYRRLTLGDVDIGYVGSRAPKDRVHARIAALRIGERLELREAPGRWLLVTGDDVIVGRMAASFAIEPGWSWLSVSVSAIMGRRCEESTPEYASRVRCDEWEVVLCELVLGPSSLSSA